MDEHAVDKFPDTPPKRDVAETLPQDPENSGVVNGVVSSVKTAVNGTENGPLTALDYSKRLLEARNGQSSVRVRALVESYKQGLRLNIDPQDYVLMADDLILAFESQTMLIAGQYEELIDAYVHNISPGLKRELEKKIKEKLSMGERPQLIKMIPILEFLDKFQINFQDLSLSGFRRYSSNELKYCFIGKPDYANKTTSLKQQLVRHGLLVLT